MQAVIGHFTFFCMFGEAARLIADLLHLVHWAPGLAEVAGLVHGPKSAQMGFDPAH